MPSTKWATERVVSSRKRTNTLSVPTLRSRRFSSAAIAGRVSASWDSSRGRLSSPARSISTSFRRSSERTSRTWSTGSASHRASASRPSGVALKSARFGPLAPGSLPTGSISPRPCSRSRARYTSGLPTDQTPPISPLRDIAFASAQPCAGASARSASTDHSPGARSRPTAPTTMKPTRPRAGVPENRKSKLGGLTC